MKPIQRHVAEPSNLPGARAGRSLRNINPVIVFDRYWWEILCSAVSRTVSRCGGKELVLSEGCFPA